MDDVARYQDAVALFQKVFGVQDRVLEDRPDARVECLRAEDLLVDGEEERGFGLEALDLDGECRFALSVVVVVVVVADGDGGGKLLSQFREEGRLRADVGEAPEGSWDGGGEDGEEEGHFQSAAVLDAEAVRGRRVESGFC